MDRISLIVRNSQKSCTPFHSSLAQPIGQTLPSSYRNVYILVAVDYVSKWVEAIATPKDDARVVIKFLKKNIFSCFGVPRALISDGGTHFCNNQLKKVLEHYNVRHKVAMPYHPQINDQAKISNREPKQYLNCSL